VEGRERREHRRLHLRVALEQVGAELPRTVARHRQPQFAERRDQRVVAVAIAAPRPGSAALPRRRAKKVGHLPFEHLLE
jgi:hypothetical protein